MSRKTLVHRQAVSVFRLFFILVANGFFKKCVR